MSGTLHTTDHMTTGLVDVAADWLRTRPPLCGRTAEAVQAARRGWGLSIPEALTVLSDLCTAGVQ